MNEMGIDAIRQEIRPKIKKEEMKYVEIEIMLQINRRGDTFFLTVTLDQK